MDTSLNTKQFRQLCKQLFSISWFGIYTAVTLQAGSISANPITKQRQAPNPANLPPPINGRNISTPLAILDNWRFSPDGLQLEFSLSAGTTPHYFYLAQPPRIVVDLPNTKLGYVSTQQNYSGAIQRVRVSQLNAAVTRIVLDLAPGSYLDPNQVKLQPVSNKNPTRWVLRPFSSGYTNSIQPGNYPQQPNNLPAIPPNYPQQPNNLPQIPPNYPQQPNNLPAIPPNYPQQPISQPNNQQLPFLTLPPPSNTLPPIPTNQQQPLVVVPPLLPNNQSQLPSSALPPPIFSNQPSNFGSPTPITKPNFPVPTLPQYPPNFTEAPVIEFGQPIPKTRN